jgi:hypothetical protein
VSDIKRHDVQCNETRVEAVFEEDALLLFRPCYVVRQCVDLYLPTIRDWREKVK